MNRKNAEQGFTILEMVIVVVILGVLSAIAVPIYLNSIRQGSIATLKSDINATAIDVGIHQNGELTNDAPISAATFNAFRSQSAGNVLTLKTYTRPGDGDTEYCVEGVHTFSATDKVTFHYNLTKRAIVSGVCVASLL